MSGETRLPEDAAHGSGAVPRKARRKRRAHGQDTLASGKLRIGDNWNVITIIALSQNNPLKAIAEFVENSIDAHASTISIVRGKDRGESYLKIVDDGEGVPRNTDGVPDFRHVATHIGDSLKRRLKEKGVQGIQGEFGIGLLSFWTVGERLHLSSAGSDGRSYQMEMRRNEPGYRITVRRSLFTHRGTDLVVRPLLPGLRQLSGERIQSYLASELRDRIRKSAVRIRILDRTSRKELEVQPRQYTGRLLHEISSIVTPRGELYVELYLNSQGPENHVSLYRSGTRVLAALEEIDAFSVEPWTSGFLQGMIDAPFLQLTPGTRTGVIQDDSFELLRDALGELAERLLEIIEQEKAAEEEQASRHILKSVQRAFREAFVTLSPDDYQWLELHKGQRAAAHAAAEGTAGGDGNGAHAAEDRAAEAESAAAAVPGIEAASTHAPAADEDAASPREFFEYPGPLANAVISPASAVMRVGTQKGLRCIARDKSRRTVDEGIQTAWIVREGAGSLSPSEGEIVTFTAPEEPGLSIVQATVRQSDVTVSAESRITVTETLLDREPAGGQARGRGLPGYTFLRAPGELWRSRYDEKNNLVVINNGHRDYVFAAQKHARKLKYICRLFAKELVLINFPGFDSRELLERMIELSLYTEENLK